MPDVIGDATVHHGMNSGSVGMGLGLFGDVLLGSGPTSGEIYMGPATLEGSATLESWAYGQLDEGDTGMHLSTLYEVQLVRDGHIAWEESFHNAVTTAGLNAVVDSTFKTGRASPTWFVGIVAGDESIGIDAGDTMASHAGWSEWTDIADATRPAYTPGTVSGGAVDNSASRAAFNINGSGSVAGFFLVDDNSLDGTDGVLYGVGTFGSGPRAVEDGDILRVSATIEAA